MRIVLYSIFNLVQEMEVEFLCSALSEMLPLFRIYAMWRGSTIGGGADRIFRVVEVSVDSYQVLFVLGKSLLFSFENV